jgi:hypothetical protein
MIIREIRESDLDKIKEIHERYYKREFSLPDFKSHFLCSYVVEDDKDEIVSVGAIRTITEVIALTDKSKSARKRIEALSHIHNASVYFARCNNYNELHAFIQDCSWEQILKKVNFKDTKGHALILEI